MDYEALKNDHFVSFQLDPNDKEYQEVEKEFCRSMHPKDTNVSGYISLNLSKDVLK